MAIVNTHYGFCAKGEAPLPELAGTWVLNERLYAPESDFAETINFQAYDEWGTRASISKIFTENAQLNFMIPASATAVYNMYNFTTNTWNTAQNLKLPIWIFPAGATASNEFRAWLASNATKQS